MRNDFEDSPKLLNLAAVCFMGNCEFEKAETTLKKLEEFYNGNPEQQFVSEFALCLKNLYVVSTILGRYFLFTARPTEARNALVDRLNTLTDGTDPLIDKMLTVQNFFGDGKE